MPHRPHLPRGVLWWTAELLCVRPAARPAPPRPAPPLQECAQMAAQIREAQAALEKAKQPAAQEGQEEAAAEGEEAKPAEAGAAEAKAE